jgi:protein ImuB
MPRLASLYFPDLAVERMRREDGRREANRSRHSSGSWNPTALAKPSEEQAKGDSSFRWNDEKEGKQPPHRQGSNQGFLPTPPLSKAMTLEEESALRGDCSCPRGGGWRPGARWAENSKERGLLAALKQRMAEESRAVHQEIAELPPHQRPAMRELGRRTDPAPVVFRSSPGRGGGSAEPRRRGSSTGEAPAESPLHRSPLASGPPPRPGEDLALVTTHKVGNRVLLAAASPAARALGLVPGMPLTQARVLVPGLEVREAVPERDAALLERLALLAARRWTPRAAVSGEDGLWLDLSGVSHLFGGEERMCAMILRTCARAGLTARLAVAGTLGAAHALARFGGAPLILLPDGAEAEALAPFPLKALRLEEEVLTAAARLGIDRIGDLIAMPRGPLQRRFGNTLLKRLDQALGRAGEPLDPIVPEDPPAMLLRFQEPIGSAEAIAQALRDAMTRLMDDLGKAGLGVRLLRFACTRVDNQIEEARIGTARATRDGAHLLRLLLPKIETIDPGFGIERLELIAARVELLGAEAIPSELTGARPAPDLALLIDRLAGRLGGRRLYRMSAVESDVPERSVRRIGVLGRPAGWPAWPRPARFLSRPEPLSGVVALLPDQPPRRFTWRGRAYRVARADGPERIHGEWWRRRAEAAAVRDYFQIEDEDGRRFWVFRKGDGIDPRTGDLSWWLQGMMG